MASSDPVFATLKEELDSADIPNGEDDLLNASESRLLSIDEAVRLVYEIHVRLESIEDYRLRLNWWMGYVVSHTHRPQGMKTTIVETIGVRLAETHGISAGRSHLYQCLRLYEGLSGDLQKYVDWIEDRKRLYGRQVYWYDILNDLLGGKNNPAVIGREEADRRDFLEAERAIEAIERVLVRARTGSQEAVGVIEGIRQSLVGFIHMGDPVPVTPRCAEYVSFVAEHACLVCGRPAEAHHALGFRGTARKPSDFGCVPLCRLHHEELHRGDRNSFEEEYGISIVEVALNLMHWYVTGAWITMTLPRIEMQGIA